MAAYTTAAEVRAVVARAPDTAASRSAAALADYQFDEAIANAQSQVDGYLRRRYTVPFPDPVPALAKALTTDIAAYLAALNWYQETELLATDPLALRYERAVALLKDIATGDIDLDAGDGGVPGVESGGGLGAPVNTYTGSLFGPADFGLGWCGDSWWGRY